MSEAAGIDLDLRNDFDDKVPRVRDVDLGERLGMTQPENIRQTIAKYTEDLSDNAILMRRVKNHDGGRGRPAKEYWLNKEQALFVAGRSDTELGRKTYRLLVRAFGLFEQMATERLPPFLRLAPGEWTKTWRDELMVQLSTLHGEIFTGRHPRWCARVNSIIYECLLGKELYAELKAQNPRPSKGRNHHQLIGAEYRAAFEEQLGYVSALAEQCGSLAELEARLRFRYQRRPIQLPLWPPMAALPPMLGPKKALPRATRTPQERTTEEAG